MSLMALNLMEKSLKQIKAVTYIKSYLWRGHHLADVIHIKKKSTSIIYRN